MGYISLDKGVDAVSAVLECLFFISENLYNYMNFLIFPHVIKLYPFKELIKNSFKLYLSLNSKFRNFLFKWMIRFMYKNLVYEAPRVG